MDEITFSDFAASGYNYIPVVRQLPLTLPVKDILRCFPESSVWQFQHHHHPYVYITLDYQHRITTWGNTLVAENGHTVHTWPDTPLWPFLEDLHAGLTVPPLETLYVDLPPLMGGMIGLLPRLPCPSQMDTWPDALWLVMKTLLIVDSRTKTLWLLAFDDPIHPHTWLRLNQKLDSLVERLTQVPLETALMREHEQKAKAALSDIMQANNTFSPAAELTNVIDNSTLAMFYNSMVSSYAAPKPELADFLAYQTYGHVAYWLQQPAFSLLGASDTVHLTLTHRELVLHLASPNSLTDDTLISLLWDSLRNDISKVALPGSMRLMNHAANGEQHHWASQSLRAEIGEDTSIFDLIKACYPNHAYLGIPKIDASTKLATAMEPHPLGCQIAMIGWDHSCFSWVSQCAKLWQANPEAHNHHGLIYEEIGSAIIAGRKLPRSGE